MSFHVGNWRAVIIAVGVAVGNPLTALADGALAVGISAGGVEEGFAYGYNFNEATLDIARSKALDGCSIAKEAPPEAQAACAIKYDVVDACVAIAFDPKSGTPGFGVAIGADGETARAKAVEACRAVGGDRRDFCAVDKWMCDGNAAP